MRRPPRGPAGRRTVPALLLLGAVAPVMSSAATQASGQVYLDGDGDGAFGRDDAGLPGVPLALYEDVDRDGRVRAGVDRAIGVALVTDPFGGYLLPALADGAYLIGPTGPAPLAGAVVAVGHRWSAFVVASARVEAPDVRFLRASVDVDGVAVPVANGSADAPAYAPRTDDGAEEGTDGGMEGGAGGAGNAGCEAAPRTAPAGTRTEAESPDRTGIVTSANNDTVVLRAGGTATIDVLANDVDGAGGGLRIVELGASPALERAAVVTGADGLDRVEVAAGSDASGTATLAYTVADAAGTSASAVLSVELCSTVDAGTDTGGDPMGPEGVEGEGGPPSGGDLPPTRSPDEAGFVGGGPPLTVDGEGDGEGDREGGGAGRDPEPGSDSGPEGGPGVDANSDPGDAATERRPTLTTSLDGVGVGSASGGSLAALVLAGVVVRLRRRRTRRRASR